MVRLQKDGNLVRAHDGKLSVQARGTAIEVRDITSSGCSFVRKMNMENFAF